MDEDLKERARQLRLHPTDAEDRVWSLLRNRQLNGHKFHRQYIIGFYIVDFVCREKNLVLELDGEHHKENIGYDEERTRFLNSQDYKVLRFWNYEVFNNIEGVINCIVNALGPYIKRSPSP